MPPAGPPPGPPVRIARPLALAATAQAVSVLPITLIGTMAVGIRGDLHFDEAALGALVAVAFGVAASLSMASGRLTERIGAAAGVRLAAVVAVASMLGMATLSRSWGTLVPYAVLAGISLAIAQPATDLWVSRTLPPSRQGVGFGVKQAAGGPGVGLLAGLAVPAVASTLGWRAAFGIGALLAAIVVLALRPSREPRRRPSRSPTRGGDVALGPLLVAGAAAALGVMAQTAFVAFIVSASVAAGVAEATAGFLFAAGSGIGCVVRILLGHLADGRARRPLVTVAAMMGAGSGGFLLLATERPAAIAAATLLLCATTWGWQGLFFLVIARSNPNAPAVASGIAATGMLTGAVLGPVLFGLLARDDYTVAWIACGASGIAAAGATLLSHRLLRPPVLSAVVPPQPV